MGLEPMTCHSVDGCSIHLSYGGTNLLYHSSDRVNRMSYGRIGAWSLNLIGDGGFLERGKIPEHSLVGTRRRSLFRYSTALGFSYMGLGKASRRQWAR